MYRTCAFTGHRNLKNTNFDASLLDRTIGHLIKNGTDTFLCGMAMGFDLESAQSVIMHKKNYDVKLIACIPCANQTERFSESARKLYERVLSRCDEVITLSDFYYPGCMHERDRYMVDNSDLIVSFLRKEKGGTFYTVNYARRQNKKIIEL